jgi:leucyl/phenylalanyl-tRNA--protein transferase
MSQIYWLDADNNEFPPVQSALLNPDGLLAAGGDLSPERLIRAYRMGIFPWYEEGQPILWWAPDPRSVIFPGKVKITRSLAKNLRNSGFIVTMDHAFEEVIHGCAGNRNYSDGTWITAEMQNAYIALHRMDLAHSVEVWLDGKLVGGLYGIALGRLFFGESMFSLVANASKVALVHLSGQLHEWGYQLIDCQLQSDHMDSLGARCIPRVEFQHYLDAFVDEPDLTGPGNWDITWQYKPA